MFGIKKQTNTDGDEEIKIKISSAVYGILILLVLAMVAASVLAYGTGTQTGKKIRTYIAKALPYPVAVIGWNNFVWASELESNVVSIQKFYKSQEANISQEGLRIDFTTPDGQRRLEIKRKELLNKLVENEAMEKLCEQNGVSVSDSDVDEAVSVKLAEFGTADDVEAQLKSTYGWTLSDFKKWVVLPDMRRARLEELASAEDTSVAEAKKKIEEAQKQLNSGKDFSEVARNYSQGASKQQGGELGWVGKEQVVSELQEALFDSKDYKNGSVTESSLGFHIVDIEEKKTEDGKSLLKLRQIFVPKETFADWLALKMKEMRIFVPLKEFTWDEEKAVVDFRDAQMREFEKTEREKASGDASLFL